MHVAFGRHVPWPEQDEGQKSSTARRQCGPAKPGAQSGAAIDAICTCMRSHLHKFGAIGQTSSKEDPGSMSLVNAAQAAAEAAAAQAARLMPALVTEYDECG